MAIYVILYLLFPFQTTFFGLLLFNDLPTLIALIIPLFQTGKDTHNESLSLSYRGNSLPTSDLLKHTNTFKYADRDFLRSVTRQILVFR